MIKKVNGKRNLSGKKRHVDLFGSILEAIRLMLSLKSLKVIIKKINLRKRRKKRRSRKKKENRRKKENKQRRNKKRRKKERRSNRKSLRPSKTINDR